MLFSVIVTTYNHEDYIEKCLTSIFEQKEVDFEVIVGDDCSTDGNLSKIRDLCKDRSNAIILSADKNIGLQKNLLRCWQKSSGSFVSICEGDDYWTDPYKLKKVSIAMDSQKKARMCFHDLQLDIGGELKTHLHTKENLPILVGVTDALLPTNFIGNFSCCTYRREVVDLIPDSFWNSTTDYDWLFNLYVLNEGVGFYLNEKLSAYRIHINSKYSSLPQEEKFKGFIQACLKYNDIFQSKYLSEFTDAILMNQAILFGSDKAVNCNPKKIECWKVIEKLLKKLKREVIR